MELKSWSAPTPAEGVEEAIGDVWPTEVLESEVLEPGVLDAAAPEPGAGNGRPDSLRAEHADS